MRLSRMLLGTSLAFVAGAATVTMLPGPAAASGPAKYGWWYEANSGLPVAPPPPPQAPSDGLYVENGFSGPSAISALTFTVPSGAQLGPMTLKISGTPTLTQAPVACSVSPASTDYKAAEGGSWAERPAFDCKKAQATGSVDSGRTAVTFNVDPFLANGSVAVVILAGGPADQIAFQKPDDSALQVTSGDVGAAPGVPPAGPGATSAAPDTSTGISNGATASSLSPDASPLPLVGSGAGAALAGPPGSAAASAPPVAGSSSGGANSGSRGYALARPTAATLRQGWRTQLATGLGLTAILIALIGWALGYGPLGGRVLPLSVPLRAPSTQARQSSPRAQPPPPAVDESRRPLA
jgi:hypothetical protein